MDHRLDLNAPKASLKLAFTGNIIDPQSETRNEESLPAALADPRIRVLVMSGGHLFMKQSTAGDAAWLTLDDAQALAVDLEQAIFLGNDAAGPVIAASSGADRDDPPTGFTAVPFRVLFVEGLVDAAVLGAVAQGASLLAWNANHRFCGRCGSETASRAGGYRRYCEACDREHFPRTDPVAIMLAARQDRCILGRSPHFAGRHVFLPCRLHRAGRNNRIGRAARDIRGIRHPLGHGRISGEPALALPLFADDRLHRRGGQRDCRSRYQRAGRLPVVFARGGAADA